MGQSARGIPRQRAQWLRQPAGSQATRMSVKRRAAFTLLEILLAMALLGLLSTVLISAGTHLMDNRPRTAAEVFWEAARTARRTALKGEADARLSFDSKEKRFVVDGGGGGTETFPVVGPRELTVDFLPPASTGGSILIGGQLMDSRSLPSVTFYTDGTCSPFRVQIRTTGPVQLIAIDPWTCAPVLTEQKSF